METVLFVIHLLVVLALIVLILLQRSEGGALGIGGGGGGNMMSSRAAGDTMTRVTTILAFCFFLTSIGIAILAQATDTPGSILDRIQTTSGSQNGGTDGVLDALPGQIEGGQTNAAPTAPAEPTAPAAPQVPTGN